jgi:hypothetical protein
MPTIPEIKAQLKELGVKGTTGKNKAELMAMLGSATEAVPKRKRPQVAPAPAPAPEVPKRKRPQVAPAPAQAPEAPKTSKREAIKSFGQWVWRRFDGNEIKGEQYKIEKENPITRKNVGAYFTIKNVKKMYPTYWEEWASIIGKTITGERMSINITKDGDIKVLKLFDIVGQVPQTRAEVDKAFVDEGSTWWTYPMIPK